MQYLVIRVDMIDYYANRRKYFAFIVGISDYEHNPKLRNATNDALAVATELSNLGYDVQSLLDVTQDEFDEEFYKFIESDKRYDVVIFYFAGHGLYSNLKDHIVFRDAKPMVEYDRMSAVRRSQDINELLQKIRTRPDNTVIVCIFDACRCDYSSTYYGYTRGLSAASTFQAAIKLPYQTFIAYATSPFAAASDGRGNHSPYTEALIRELRVVQQPIETTFKNIRRHVYQEAGNQIPWEHSCIVDDITLNPGPNQIHTGCIYEDGITTPLLEFVQNSHLPHTLSAVDSSNETLLSTLNECIRCIHNYSINAQFVLGRIIYWQIVANRQSKPNLLTKLSISRTIDRGVSHVLNGFLYAFYFDYGLYEDPDKRHPQLIDQIHSLCTDKDYKASVTFITEQLQLHGIDLFYTPGSQRRLKTTLHLRDVNLLLDSGEIVHFLDLSKYDSDTVFLFAKHYGQVMGYRQLREMVWEHSQVPHELFLLTPSEEVKPYELVYIGNYADLINNQQIKQLLSTEIQSAQHSNVTEATYHYEISSLTDFDVADVNIVYGDICIEGNLTAAAICYTDDEAVTHEDVDLQATYVIEMTASKSGHTITLNPFNIAIHYKLPTETQPYQF